MYRDLTALSVAQRCRFGKPRYGHDMSWPIKNVIVAEHIAKLPIKSLMAEQKCRCYRTGNQIEFILGVISVTIYRDRTALSIAVALLVCKASVGPRHVVAEKSVVAGESCTVANYKLPILILIFLPPFLWILANINLGSH